MLVRVDDVTFTAPTGLEDGTNYSFRASDPREEFSLEFELPAGSATPAPEVLADVRQQHVDYLQAKFGVDEQGERLVAGTPASFMRYHFDDRGETKLGVLAVANLGSEAADGDWVKLSWLHEGSQTELSTVVDGVIASFAKAPDPPPAPTQDHWTRRQAGIWAFDLPARYVGPHSYLWEDVEAELRVQISVHPYDADKPDLEARVAAAVARGRTIVAREDVPIIYGDLVRLELRDAIDDQWFVCRAVQGYEVGNPVRVRWIEVGASGPFTRETELRRLVDNLLASITVEGRR